VVDPRIEFDRFAERACPMLLRSAFLLTRDRDDAEDLLQATLYRVARRWEAISSSPDAYAYRVLVNLARDRRRNLGRRPAEVPQDIGRFEPAGDETERVVERDAMTALVRGLPNKQREVIVLRFFLDLSVEETAAALGCSRGTVKSHTSRALRSLRSLVADAGRRDPVQTEVPNAE